MIDASTKSFTNEGANEARMKILDESTEEKEIEELVDTLLQMEQPKCRKIKQLNENLAVMGASISDMVNLHKDALLKYFQEIY